MEIVLDEPEARVLGCLIEKEGTTPDNYPLSVNSLISACNQKTNRSPVVDYNEEMVLDALDRLRDKNLVYLYLSGSSRVRKYKHLAPKILEVSYPELSLICVLLLRGPQTVGEIKTRTSRLYGFADIDHVLETLRSLMSRDVPLVVDVGRRPGQKESRFAHLLSGEVATIAEASTIESSTPLRPAGDDIMNEIKQLKDEIDKLRSEFESFRSQFE